MSDSAFEVDPGRCDRERGPPGKPGERDTLTVPFADPFDQTLVSAVPFPFRRDLPQAAQRTSVDHRGSWVVRRPECNARARISHACLGVLFIPRQGPADLGQRDGVPGAERHVPHVFLPPPDQAVAERRAGSGVAVVEVGMLREGRVGVDPPARSPRPAPRELDVACAVDVDAVAEAVRLGPGGHLVHHRRPREPVARRDLLPEVAGPMASSRWDRDDRAHFT